MNVGGKKKKKKIEIRLLNLKLRRFLLTVAWQLKVPLFAVKGKRCFFPRPKRKKNRRKKRGKRKKGAKMIDVRINSKSSIEIL